VLDEVDRVGADVTEGARAGRVLVETPGHRAVLVREPVLQVVRAHLPDLTEPPLLDELTGECDRRHAAVAEADHRAHAGTGCPLGRLRHPNGLLHRVRQGLLAEHVLACVEGCDGDLGMRVARRADVDDVDGRVVDDTAPVGLRVLPAELLASRFDPRGVTPDDRVQHGLGVEVEESRRDAPPLRVRGAHESVADHGHAEGRLRRAVHPVLLRALRAVRT
jgi:hypothetical protein